ncbi:hypothetical protein M0Q97_08030 [Candidatus Dojkabacteria bacterium]|jgi:hypothetical protein|nr:hypothetical protein [Candidatus Dojkabacteria bacterium]
MRDMKKIYDSLSELERIYSDCQKWDSVVEQCLDLKLNLKFKKIIIVLSKFCEKYEAVTNMLFSPWTPIAGNAVGNYPAGTQGRTITPPIQLKKYQQDILQQNDYEYTVLEALELFKTDIYDYMFSILVDCTIKSKYYNIFTGREGIALENGLFIENEKILNKKVEDKINDDLLKLIDKRIDFILRPEIRQSFLREKKLNRILK